ncbi:MAG: prepilin-type N-terminal cleavage/methylation domain-containing protein, partial [Inhella sp.]
MDHQDGTVTKRQAGLTLLEMLVALLIAAMATTLLAQAMRQLAGVERLLERSGYQG